MLSNFYLAVSKETQRSRSFEWCRKYLWGKKWCSLHVALYHTAVFQPIVPKTPHSISLKILTCPLPPSSERLRLICTSNCWIHPFLVLQRLSLEIKCNLGWQWQLSNLLTHQSIWNPDTQGLHQKTPACSEQLKTDYRPSYWFLVGKPRREKHHKR